MDQLSSFSSFFAPKAGVKVDGTSAHEVSPEHGEITAGMSSRRQFLRAALVASGGLLLVSPSQALAFFFRSRDSELNAMPQTEIPEEWLRKLGPEVTKYVAFLERQRLKHIRVEQIIESHLKRRGQVQNTLPPKNYWRQVRGVLRATELLAEKLGEPVREVVSAYRSPQYNRLCGGVCGSYHLRNMALDLRFRSSPRQVALAARELREQGHFLGGVGRYPTFTHLDTRGYKADW